MVLPLCNKDASLSSRLAFLFNCLTSFRTSSYHGTAAFCCAIVVNTALSVAQTLDIDIPLQQVHSLLSHAIFMYKIHHIAPSCTGYIILAGLYVDWQV